MSFTISCFLVGDLDIFGVAIDGTMAVGQLKLKIKEQKQALKDIDANQLTLHQGTIDISLGSEAFKHELNRLSENSHECTPLDHTIEVLSANIYENPPAGKMYIILVRTPEVPTATSPQHVRGRAVVAYIEEVVFRSDQTGADYFEKTTLEANDIYEQTALHPNSTNEIRQKLDERRTVSPKQLNLLKYGFEDDVIAQHFSDIDGSGGTCTDTEITHYLSLYIDRPLFSALDYDAVKYKAATPFFRSIAGYLCSSYVNKAVFKREGRWPLKFVAQVGDTNERYSYEPRSDYLFSLDTCPRIDIEVSSSTHRSDCYRMLLRAGLLVRVVNKLTRCNSFVAIAIYITTGFIAEWYIVYQPKLDDKKIIYFKDGVFDLETPLGRFQFFHRLYNVPSALPDDGLSMIKADLFALNEKVEAYKYKEFTTFTKPPKPKTHSNTPPSSSNTTDIDNSPTDQMFVNAKYQVLPEIKLPEGWTRLNPLPLTVCRARGPGDKRVILKIVKPREFKIHSFLARIRSPENHTIPILHDIPRGLGKLIAMQRETVLSNVAPQLLKTKGHLLAREFLEGVRFMHNHHVAHLDLKPDNIVVTTSTNQLFIIDFGVSVQVSGLESWIKGYRGTEGWAAPELEVNSDREYQPIRADLWSAGVKVLC